MKKRRRWRRLWGPWDPRWCSARCPVLRPVSAAAPSVECSGVVFALQHLLQPTVRHQPHQGHCCVDQLRRQRRHKRQSHAQQVQQRRNLALDVGPQQALELGVPGLVAFLWLLMAVLGRSLRALPRLSRRDQGVLAALVAALAGFLLHGAVDNVWYSPKLTLLFWVVLGLAVSLGKEADSPASTACNE